MIYSLINDVLLSLTKKFNVHVRSVGEKRLKTTVKKKKKQQKTKKKSVILRRLTSACDELPDMPINFLFYIVILIFK
jgi:hypothetical protein